MSAEVSTEAPKKLIKPLTPESMAFEDARLVRHVVFVPRDTDPQLLTESRMWLNLAQRLHPLDHLLVFWDDRSAMANLICLEVSQSFVSMLLIDYRKLPGIISDGSEALINFEIFYSQMQGYCCRRLSDNVMIVQNATSREKAIEELKAHPSFRAAE
ncbi:hypothetical protein [Pseudomonas migulae]